MFKKLNLLIISSTLLLSGCQSMQSVDPFTGATKTSNTATFGGIGAVTGAAIGAIADGGEGALIGALLGGVAGASYGSYADQQEALLKTELQGTGVQVARYGDNLKLILPGHITFDSRQSAIKSSFYPVLNSVAKVTTKFDQNLVEVRGYTDSTGGFDINFPLSKSRAEAVSHYLIGQGVSASRMSIHAMASAHPIATNATEAGRAQNRRVEITLRPRA